jgi:hypothetical protein
MAEVLGFQQELVFTGVDLFVHAPSPAWSKPNVLLRSCYGWRALRHINQDQ